MTIPGLVTMPAKSDVPATLAKLEAEIHARGMTVFARIDHAAGALAAGLPLRPTTLLIFGSAKAGTPLMQQAQTLGIDLPLKFLVWQDEGGATQISYTDPAWTVARHGLAPGPVSNGMASVLSAIAATA